MCPNINLKETRNEFNSIVEALGGKALTIEEFKNKELRNQRSGVDDSAMQAAYLVWDKTNGSPKISGDIRKYTESIINGEKDINSNNNSVSGKQFQAAPDADASVESRANVNNNAGILPIKNNFDLYTKLNLLNKKGGIKEFTDKTEAQMKRIVEMKNNRKDVIGKYRLFYKKHPNEVGYAIWVKSISPISEDPLAENAPTVVSVFEKASMAADNKSSRARRGPSEAADGTQLSLFDMMEDSQNKVSKKASKQAIKVMVRIADEMSRRFNIKYKIISVEDAYNQLKQEEPDLDLDKFKKGGTRGFYRRDTGEAFLISGRFDAATAIHEIFGHPFLDIISKNEDTVGLYNQLAVEAAKDLKLVGSVSRVYSEIDNKTKTDELILAMLGKVIRERKDISKESSAIREFFKKITDFICSLFNKQDHPEIINPGITINQLADWLLFGNGYINLMPVGDRANMEAAVDDILKVFTPKVIKDARTSSIKFNEILNIKNGDYFNVIHEAITKAGIPTVEYLNKNLKAKLSDVHWSDGIDTTGVIFRRDSVTKFKIDRRGNIGFISEISSVDDVLSLVNHIDSSGLTNLVIEIENAKEISEQLSKLIPLQSFSYVNTHGRDVIVFSAVAREMNLPATNVSMEILLPSDVHNQNAIEFIEKVSSGLKAQVHALERKGSRSVTGIDRIKNLIDEIESSDISIAMLKFIDHAKIEVESALRAISLLNESMNKGERLDVPTLIDIRRNFLSLYSSAMDSISRLESNLNGPLSTLPAKDMENVENTIDSINKSLKRIDGYMYNLVKYEYANTLLDVAEEAGSDTMRESIGTNVYSEPADISLISLAVGATVVSKIEQIRILNKIISDVDATTNRELETSGVLRNLFVKWDKVRSKHPYATYSKFMEHDSKGKATGYMLSPLKYGVFQKDLSTFEKNMKDKYGISSFDDLPDDEAVRTSYIKERESWLAKHTERMFVPEYYKLKKSLSKDTSEVLEESETAIRLFKNKFRDENGILRTDKMTDEDKDVLYRLNKDKASLSMLVYPDGRPKIVGSYDYSIAIELKEFNKKLSDNLKYKVNNEAYEEARIAASKKSPAEYDKWLKDNTRVEFAKEFWDLMASLEKEDQLPEWQEMYDVRAELLKLNRDPETMEVKGLDIAERPDGGALESVIKRLDKKLQETKIPSSYTPGSTRFKDIAEILPTAAYQKKELEMRNGSTTPEGKKAFQEWWDGTHYIDASGRVARYSHWNKLEPKNKKYISRVPNSIWSEIDESSNFYNKEFDRSMEEHGLQPKKDIYDNSDEYNKLMSIPEYAEFLTALQDAYRTANKNFHYIKRTNNLRLAQIPGGFVHKLRHPSGDKFFSGLMEALSDEFHYRPYDINVGDHSTKDLRYADGSPVLVVQTMYRTMLDNPDAISRDLLGAFAAYYRSAIRFKHMSNETPRLELIVEGLKNTSINSEKKKKNPGESMLYQKAREYVNSEAYGRDDANSYDISFRATNPITALSNTVKKIFGKPQNAGAVYEGKFSIAKPFTKRVMGFISKLNLSGNIKAITSNFVGAAVHSKIEASCGTFMDNETYWAGHAEVVKSMPSIIESLTNRSENKIIALMRYYGIARSNEADMSGLHGAKLTRALASNFWYGPYSAGDFAIKSTSMVAALMHIRLYNGKFYSKEQFISRFYPKDRAAGEAEFKSIKDTLFSAYEMKDGILSISDKYKDAVTPGIENFTAAMLHDMGRRLDGSLTGSEKTKLHKDIFGSMILLHRNYLLWAAQERFHPNMFRYDKGFKTSGMYRFGNVKIMPVAATRMLVSKLAQIASIGKIKDAGKYKDRYSISQQYAAKRITGEIVWFVVLGAIAVIIAKSIGDDDEDRKSSSKMLAYILMLRVALEVGSLSSPLELWNLQKSPSAAQSVFQQIKDIYDMFSDNTWDSKIKSGIYKNKTKLFRSATKLIPIWKNAYPTFVEPDYRNDERFMRSNIGGSYEKVENLLWKDNPRAVKKRKEDEKEYRKNNPIKYSVPF